MKTIEWLNFLRLQREQHGKVVFTFSELANVAQCSPRVLNVELARLVKRGIMVRYAHGRYGGVEGITVEQILPYLDSAAYITGFYALFTHNVVTQRPFEITCFTNHRLNKSRIKKTAVGKFVFVCVGNKIYDRPEEGVLASPEQALCDFIFLSSRSSLKVQNLVTFRRLQELDWDKVAAFAARYPKTVLAQLEEIKPISLGLRKAS